MAIPPAIEPFPMSALIQFNEGLALDSSKPTPKLYALLKARGVEEAPPPPGLRERAFSLGDTQSQLTQLKNHAVRDKVCGMLKVACVVAVLALWILGIIAAAGLGLGTPLGLAILMIIGIFVIYCGLNLEFAPKPAEGEPKRSSWALLFGGAFFSAYDGFTRASKLQKSLKKMLEFKTDANSANQFFNRAIEQLTIDWAKNPEVTSQKVLVNSQNSDVLPSEEPVVLPSEESVYTMRQALEDTIYQFQLCKQFCEYWCNQLPSSH